MIVMEFLICIKSFLYIMRSSFDDCSNTAVSQSVISDTIFSYCIDQDPVYCNSNMKHLCVFKSLI